MLHEFPLKKKVYIKLTGGPASRWKLINQEKDVIQVDGISCGVKGLQKPCSYSCRHKRICNKCKGYFLTGMGLKTGLEVRYAALYYKVMTDAELAAHLL
jgi:hypothetical protein